MTLFYHLAGIGEYKAITAEIFAAITSSKLIEKLDEIVVSFVGDKKDFNALKFPVKNVTLIYSGNVKEYEYPTINLLQNHCKNNPLDTVLYCHSKGVSKDTVQEKYWRKALIKYTITNWEECVEHLTTFDLVGYNWCNNHFSGNFWWAKSSTINTTKNIHTFKTNPIKIANDLKTEERKRLQCEFFISTIVDAKVKSVGTEGYDWKLIPVCIDLDITGTQDPFDFAGIKVDKRFLLNLQTRPDKKRKVDILLNYHNIRDVKTIPAINGKVLGIQCEKVINPGIAACYISWLGILNMCYAEGYETVLMLEDDVLFQYGFKELLKEGWKNIPSDWDIIWVGGNERYGIPGKHIAGNIYTPKDIWGTHCMLLSKNGIEKIVNRLNNKNIDADVDIEITRNIPNLKQYSFFPTLALQNANSLSDIRGSHIK